MTAEAARTLRSDGATADVPPRIAMLVANDVTGVSRVQKTAWSAAEAGYDVLLVGYDPNAPAVPVRTTWIGAARVVRTGLADRHRLRADALAARAARAEQAHRSPADRLADRLRHDALRAASWAARLDYRARRRLMRSVRQPGTGGPGGRERAKEVLWRLYVRDGNWRRTARHLVLLENTWAEVVCRFRPEIIHAHDMHTPGIAVRIADRLQRTGHPRPTVVYDAHEFVAGVHMPVQRLLAYTALEREFVHRVDAVVTVSGTLAELLQERYALPRRPTVVANAPLPTATAAPSVVARTAAPTADTGLRARLGLDEDVPLLVYSGAVSPARGVEVLADALPRLPGVHAAVVCADPRAPHIRALLDRAEELGAGPRMHAVPYVAPARVPDFLRSATVGVVPILHTPNHEVALITKYYEYLHARLPVVVSDVTAMAARTRQLGCGEVFRVRTVAQAQDVRLRQRDADAFARAAARVLADPARYTAAYTDLLLAENSWPGQAARLGDLYTELTGRRPHPLPGHRPLAETESDPDADPNADPESAVEHPTPTPGRR